MLILWWELRFSISLSSFAITIMLGLFNPKQRFLITIFPYFRLNNKYSCVHLGFSSSLQWNIYTLAAKRIQFYIKWITNRQHHKKVKVSKMHRIFDLWINTSFPLTALCSQCSCVENLCMLLKLIVSEIMAAKYTRSFHLNKQSSAQLCCMTL